VSRSAVAKAAVLWQFSRMKAFIMGVLLLAGLMVAAQAQSQADDKYIGIYNLIQSADHLAETGDASEAVAAYADAQKQLQVFQRVYPTWSPNIVSFRLNQVIEKIAALKASVAAPVVAARKTEPAATAPAGVEAANGRPAGDYDELHSQLQAAVALNESLKAKLKEALAVQPAAVDPRELARAQEKIRAMMKEHDLLKSSRSGAGPGRVETQYITNLVRVVVTNSPVNPVEVTRLADVFARNTNVVIVTNIVRTVVVDTNAMEMLRLDYAAAVKNFNDEHSRSEQLATELQRLQKLSASAPAATTNAANPANATNAMSATLLATVQAENAALKFELGKLRAAMPAPTDGAKLADEIKQARAQIAQMKSNADILALEKIALERRVQQLTTATNSSASIAAYESRIRELTQDRNNLIERLDLANQQKAGGNSPELVAQLAALNSEVSKLRSRLAVAEAQPVPFTEEELAFFKTTVPAPAKPSAEKRSIKEMPAGTAELVTSAQQHFARQEFDQAEADYQKILDRDQNNGIALANLATIELQQGKLEEAEKHIQAALALSPDDAYNLSTLGFLKFRQGKYDEALNNLSRAAQLDPNNPEIQNYLGVTLGHQGQRKQAETALRRAIQMAPNYAPAHNNLAVLYLAHTPPLAELARWHYQKALEAGQPRNPDLEKALAEKGAPVQRVE
jgi:tetratricopeptide (TPR) repeat protein